MRCTCEAEFFVSSREQASDVCLRCNVRIIRNNIPTGGIESVIAIQNCLEQMDHYRG